MWLGWEGRCELKKHLNEKAMIPFLHAIPSSSPCHCPQPVLLCQVDTIKLSDQEPHQCPRQAGRALAAALAISQTPMIHQVTVRSLALKMENMKKNKSGLFSFDLMEKDICWQKIKFRINHFFYFSQNIEGILPIHMVSKTFRQ